MMGADDVRPTSREELKALPKKERKRLLLAAVTKVEEKIAWLEEQLVETSAERDELKDNEVPRLVQESQQCREDLRQLQETHDATLTTHATELQWWKSEVEKKALIISQQVEEIERARDELEEMKGQKDKDAASALKQSEVLARCQEDLEKCQQEAEKRKEEFSKQAEEMQITQAANAQINEDAMRLQKELDQCRAEAEEFQALRAETERLRAADVAATLLLSEKEEELQYLAEELGESRHHVARLEYQMKWMVEEAEEAEEDATPTTEVWGFASARWADSSDSEEAEEAEDATPTTEVWGFASARWADSSDSEADSDLELDPGASAMTVDGFCDRPEASSLFEVHWANIPVEAVAFEAKGRFFLGWDGHAPDAKAAAELDELAEDELDRAQVFKTAMCKFWRRGTCIYGENCNFVHGEEEKQPLYKAKLCKYFQRGHCTRGANCTFAHGVEELQDGTAPTPLAADFGVSPYKRKICKFWMRGACWAGESCTYAHGAEELQHPEVGRAAWAPRTPENSAWNINYETRYEPEMYFGRWENHSYFPSPSDWRSFSIYQPITDGCLYTFCFTSQRE